MPSDLHQDIVNVCRDEIHSEFPGGSVKIGVKTSTNGGTPDISIGGKLALEVHIPTNQSRVQLSRYKEYYEHVILVLPLSGIIDSIWLYDKITGNITHKLQVGSITDSRLRAPRKIRAIDLSYLLARASTGWGDWALE